MQVPKFTDLQLPLAHRASHSVCLVGGLLAACIWRCQPSFNFAILVDGLFAHQII